MNPIESFDDAALNRLLLERLPEFRPAYLALYGTEDPSIEPSGIVYGDTVGPWLARKPFNGVPQPELHVSFLGRVFDLLETLAAQPDESIARYTLHHSVFHWMFSEADQRLTLREYAPFMGEKTRAAALKASPRSHWDSIVLGGWPLRCRIEYAPVIGPLVQRIMRSRRY